MNKQSSRMLDWFLWFLLSWEGYFAQLRTHKRFVRLSIASICSLSNKTVAGALRAIGLDQKNPSAENHLFSRADWDAASLFEPIFKEAVKLHHPHRRYIPIALDDTHLRKSGRRIEGAGWNRDPLGPPFQANLAWMLRFVQATILIPIYDRHGLADKYETCPAPARSIPVAFEAAPKIPNPKNADAPALAEYKRLKEQAKVTTIFMRIVHRLRTLADRLGYDGFKIIAIGDGSYCNKSVFMKPIANVVMLCRARKDAVLCRRAVNQGQRIYDTETFTPHDVLINPETTKKNTRIFYAGKFRTISYKEVSNVLWRGGAKTRPLRLLVVSGVRARKRTKKSSNWHHDPAYLLTTDLEIPASDLLSMYFDRWEIEVNHRDEKSALRTGSGQFKTSKGASRWAAWSVAMYAALQLASILAYGTQRDPNIYGRSAIWDRTPPNRPTIGDMLRRLRLEAINQHDRLKHDFEVDIDPMTLIFAA